MALHPDERRRRNRVAMQDRRRREAATVDGGSVSLRPERLTPDTPLHIRCERCGRHRDTTLGALGFCPGCGSDGREPGEPIVLGMVL